jgi:hypothetical protein
MADLRIGMIGLDTSHCEAFVSILNNPDNPHHVPGGRITGAYPGGSQLTAVSRDRVGKFTETLRDKHQIPIYDSIEKLAKDSDAFVLNSVDGRQHLEQFAILARYRRPVFIDKPLACSFDDAAKIIELGQQHDTPVMSCSSVRFSTGVTNLVPKDAKLGSCEVFGTMSILDDYPPYFWYGIHGAELLFCYMGKGCRTAQAVHENDMDLLIGRWGDGRIGTVRGLRFSKYHFGITVFTSVGTVHGLSGETPPSYALLLQKVVPFLETGASPIDPEETLQIMAFLDAAEHSLKNKGQVVTLPV